MRVLSKAKRKIPLRIAVMTLLSVLCSAAVLCNSFIPQSFADKYSTNVFPVVSMLMQNVNMFFQYSLTENAIICLAPLAVIGVVIWLVVLVKKILGHGALIYLYKSFRDVLILVLIAAVIFQAMHGFNYRRTHVTDELELVGDELTYDDYCKALTWAYQGMIEARSHLGEDYNGVAHLSESFENTSAYANELLNSFSEEYDIPLSRNFVRAKPVSMSHYWSYTYIVGMYDPYLAEANVNTDYISACEFPITVCHELSHAKGYASETDCNTLATLACCCSDRADFRYAGFYEIFWNLYSVTEGIGDQIGEVPPQFGATKEMEPVYRDMRASSLYWEGIDKEIEEIKQMLGIDIAEASNTVNDAFLKTNGETGVDSYVVPDSSYVRFYLTYFKGDQDA